MSEASPQPELFGRKSIRRALKSWSNSRELGKHPLAGLTVIDVRRRDPALQYANTATGRGIVLRQLLLEQIETIKPEGKTADFSHKQWRLYTILQEQFVNGRRAQDIRDELGISESGYFTDQRQALDRLGNLLREAELPYQTERGADSTAIPPAAKTADLLAPAAAPPLPQHPTPFLGREEELAQILDQLQNDDCRLVSLIGPGGVGKTRLGLEAARAAQSLFAAVYYVPLAPLGAVDFLVPAIAKAVGLNFDNQEDPEAQLFNFLRQKQVLLLCDNFEHLMHGAALVARILREASGVKIIATSRERLNLRGEWVIPIHGMKFPQPGAAEQNDVETYSAVQLFLQTAERLQPDRHPGDEELIPISRICQLVRGLPLALELAASWVNLLSCAEIAAEIEKNLDFLEGTFRDLPERHQSLRAVFDHSWNLLTGAEKNAFRKLAVFRGSFHWKAAQRVAGATLPQLMALSSKSLLRTPTPGRYEAHELLRQFAAEKLEAAPEEYTATRDHHARHYATFLQSRQVSLKQGGGQKEALIEIEQEFENIRAAWRWAIQRDATQTLQNLVEPLYLTYVMLNLYREGEEALQRALTHWQEQPTLSATQQQLAGFVQGLLARIYFRLGQPAQNRQHFVASLGRLTAVGPDAYRALISALAIQSSLDSPDLNAHQLYAASTAIFAEMDDQWGLANCYYEYGAYIHISGETKAQDKHSEAQRLVSQSLALRRRIGDSWGVAACLHYLGHAAYTIGDYQKARSYTEQSLEISHQISDRLGIAEAYNSLGQIASTVGDYDEAKEYYQRCLDIRQEFGNRIHIAECLDSLGFVYYVEGDLARAEAYYQESLQLSQATNDKHGLAWSLHNLGDIARMRQEYAQAKHLYAESQAIHKSTDPLDWGRAVALEKLGRVTLALGEWTEAEHWFTVALQIAIKTKRYREASDAILGMSQLLLAQEKKEETIRYLTLIINHHATAKETVDQARELLTELREQIDPEAVTAAETAGREMTLPEAAGEICA